MIQDAERVPLYESHPDLAERGVRDPLIAVPRDLGARQPCGPARQVPRVGGELVDLGSPAGDIHADMLDLAHGTTSLGCAGLCGVPVREKSSRLEAQTGRITSQ